MSTSAASLPPPRPVGAATEDRDPLALALFGLTVVSGLIDASTDCQDTAWTDGPCSADQLSR